MEQHRAFVAKQDMSRIRAFWGPFLLRFDSDKWDLTQIWLRLSGQKNNGWSLWSEASKGAFYLCPAVLSGYCCACGRGYCYTIIVIFINWVPYRGSLEMSQIWVQRWHFLMLLGYCWFWWYFITKVWSVHITIIVIFILIFNIDVWKCPFGCRGHTFKASGFLLILMIFHWCWY